MREIENQMQEFVDLISGLGDDFQWLKSTFQYLSDSHSVLTSIVKSHEYLDRILSKKA